MKGERRDITPLALMVDVRGGCVSLSCVALIAAGLYEKALLSVVLDLRYSQ